MTAIVMTNPSLINTAMTSALAISVAAAIYFGKKKTTNGVRTTISEDDGFGENEGAIDGSDTDCESDLCGIPMESDDVSLENSTEHEIINGNASDDSKDNETSSSRSDLYLGSSSLEESVCNPDPSTSEDGNDDTTVSTERSPSQDNGSIEHSLSAEDILMAQLEEWKRAKQRRTSGNDNLMELKSQVSSDSSSRKSRKSMSVSLNKKRLSSQRSLPNLSTPNTTKKNQSKRRDNPQSKSVIPPQKVRSRNATTQKNGDPGISMSEAIREITSLREQNQKLQSESHKSSSLELQLKTLERQNLSLQSVGLEISRAEGEKNRLEERLELASQELKERETLHESLQRTADEAKMDCIAYRCRLERKEKEFIATNARLNAIESTMESVKTDSKQILERTERKLTSLNETLTTDIAILRSRHGVEGDDGREEYGEDDPATLRVKMMQSGAVILKLEKRIREGEISRRQMHNRIQELRGNVRVFVRVRPFIPLDDPGDSSLSSPIELLSDGTGLSIADPSTLMKERMAFSFDQVFGPCDSQTQVFHQVSDFVQSALDGYQVCMFSYGQTGSGKTHTMQGSCSDGDMRGVIPRTVELILNQAVELATHQNWEFTFTVSFLEIYNEELRDLLVTDKPARTNEPGTSSSRIGGSTPPKLTIKRDLQSKKLFVQGLSKLEIDSHDIQQGMKQLQNLMTKAEISRSIAATTMNLESSRSHAVFVLDLHGVNKQTKSEVNGSLSLCDLAGSERLARNLYGTNVDSKRLKETQCINKSLSCLGDVFNALANGSSHIPFRNSKLTYLLQDCLSGDGKALMFVNLSPTLESCKESLHSLRFAQRVNQIELGQAKKNVHTPAKKSVKR